LSILPNRRIRDGDFLIYYMQAESFDRAAAAVAQSSHAIDAYHQQFKHDTWVAGQRLELLLNLTRPQPVPPGSDATAS
jgi:hypothetical protein